jgi:DNA invertase Pin-like site-specific DNA recombinase
MIGAVVQFERKIMLERQREGIAKARAEGKYKVRTPTAPAKTTEIKTLRDQGIGAAENREAAQGWWCQCLSDIGRLKSNSILIYKSGGGPTTNTQPRIVGAQ